MLRVQRVRTAPRLQEILEVSVEEVAFIRLGFEEQRGFSDAESMGRSSGCNQHEQGLEGATAVN